VVQFLHNPQTKTSFFDFYSMPIYLLKSVPIYNIFENNTE